MLVARHIWHELGLEERIDQLSGRHRSHKVLLSDRALVLVANRLMSPGSEHALARWLENEFVCDHRGRRFVASWREDEERKASRTPRVRVKQQQLKYSICVDLAHHGPIYKHGGERKRHIADRSVHCQRLGQSAAGLHQLRRQRRSSKCSKFRSRGIPERR